MRHYTSCTMYRTRQTPRLISPPSHHLNVVLRQLTDIVFYILLFITTVSNCTNSIDMGSTAAVAPIQFDCMFCPYSTSLFTAHLSHRQHHRHINNNRFHCGHLECKTLLTSERLLRLHIIRVHKLKVRCNSFIPNPTPNIHGKYVCNVITCKEEFEDFSKLLSHLKRHIRKGGTIICPHDSCQSKYNQLSSFTGHLSRKHCRKRICSNVRPVESINENIFEGAFEINLLENNSNNMTEVRDLFQGQDCSNFEESEEDKIMSNLAQFCMKLEFHYLVSETTVQFAVNEIFKIHRQSKEFFQSELLKTLKSENIPIGTSNRIVRDCFSKDPFEKQYDQNWKSSHRRKEFYKKTFAFVNPEKIPYVKTKKLKGGITTNVKTFFYYVDVKKTLEASFCADKSLNLTVKPVQPRTDGLLADITDGRVFRDNIFFQENPLCVRIVIYQDGLELVNPLGSAKRIHKVLAVYLSILNLPDHLRSHINSIKLVALCNEKLFDHNVVYGKIVDDLKILEDRGIQLPDGSFVKVGLVCISGDNLGSHGLGGFLENFSTATYFCRFCHATKNAFHGKDGESMEFDLRTVASYNHCVAKVRQTKKNYKGVKYNSIFNKLKAFHVCNPGLPPCYGHDLLEGIAAYDGFLFIKYFVEYAEWFTFHELNEAIASFAYSSEDRKDRPIAVQEEGTRIKGGAWQIWTLLRLFPLIMMDYIVDCEDPVFRALMLLTEIIEIIAAPTIHKSHLPYLHTLIGEYLSARIELFPHVPLRPKHHYLSHYSFLAFCLGPAGKVFTLRYESKHTVFKRIARFIRNFKNVLKSLAMKHELLQCYLRSGADFRALVEVFGASDLCLPTYAASIQNVIRNACSNVADLQECKIAVVKGTLYKKSDIVVLNQESYESNLSLGRILIILYDCGETVHFVCEKLETTFDTGKRLYKIGVALGYQCIRADQLLSFYPHKPYHGCLIKLKHAIVCQPA